MGDLKSWGLTVCFAALAAGIASIIAPSGKLEKIFKYAVSLFFLCCMLVPLFSLKGISLNKITNDAKVTFETNKLDSSVKSEAKDLAAENIKKIIAELCSENGVTPEDVAVVLISDKSGALNTQSITLKLSKKDIGKKDFLIKEIEKKYGLTVKITEGER